MKNEELFQILGGIDSKFIEKASEDLAFWQESQKGIRVRIDNSRKFAWKTMFASVACTAALMLGIFALLLNLGIVGKIETIEGPASSGVELNNSSDSQSNALPEFPSNTVFFEEAAYAFRYEFDVLQRYEVGDKFGENAKITSAKTTYKNIDGKTVMQKQEIVLQGRFVIETNSRNYETDGATFINIRIGRMNELGLPFFGSHFDIDPLHCALTDENINGEGSIAHITFINLIITVDYERESITIDPQTVLSVYFD